MKEPWLTIWLWIAAFLPPIISGPGAAALFVAALKSERRWALPLFWLALPILDLAVMVWVMFSLGDIIGPGAIACTVMPFVALGTALGLMLSRKRVYRDLGEDERRRKWYGAGVLVIPSLQIVMMGVIAVLAPYRPGQ